MTSFALTGAGGRKLDHSKGATTNDDDVRIRQVPSLSISTRIRSDTDVTDNEHIVSAVRLDEQEEPENEAEELIVEEMTARDADGSGSEPGSEGDDNEGA